VFCDASIKAYASAICLRMISKKTIKTNLIISKLTLAPLGLKKHSKGAQGQLSMEFMAVMIGVAFVKTDPKVPIAKRMVFMNLNVFYTGLVSFQCLT